MWAFNLAIDIQFVKNHARSVQQFEREFEPINVMVTSNTSTGEADTTAPLMKRGLLSFSSFIRMVTLAIALLIFGVDAPSLAVMIRV